MAKNLKSANDLSRKYIWYHGRQFYNFLRYRKILNIKWIYLLWVVSSLLLINPNLAWNAEWWVLLFLRWGCRNFHKIPKIVIFLDKMKKIVDNRVLSYAEILKFEFVHFVFITINHNWNPSYCIINFSISHWSPSPFGSFSPLYLSVHHFPPILLICDKFREFEHL